MSRIIKSQYTNAADDGGKIIKIRSFDYVFQDEYTDTASANYEIGAGKVTEAARSEAEATIREARQQAEEILQQAEAARAHFEEVEKRQMMQEAREIGFNEGMEFGKQKGYEECADMIENAKKIITVSKNDYKDHIEASETTILELGITVADRIIGTRLQESEEVYLSIVKQAIKEIRDQKEVQLHIHPSHYEYILSQKEELIAIFPKDTEFYIYPDQEIGENSCIIESEHGRIDAGVDSQLTEIKQKLVDLLEGE